jgi:chorismate lyase / 3-hydroxybenzoate synthase
VLGRIAFGVKSGRPFIEDGVPVLPLHMPNDAGASFAEAWTSNAPVRAGTFNELVYAHNDEFLFCAGFIPDTGHYAEAARFMYADAFALVGKLAYPTIFRMWNFIPRINEANAEGLEVYRDFCRGRALAFEQGYAGESAMPSATGIGTWGEGIGFCFLACRESVAKHIENTRQIPAYAYPERYGPKPPSFARATHLTLPGAHAPCALFVSGTASIVGHETMHAGNLRLQWQTMTENVAHLIGRENLAANASTGGYTLRDLDQIKLYYRRSDDLPTVKRLAADAFHPAASVEFMKVDICRADLLVEMEGVARAR